ncbi:SpoVK/Ycf46/Vps4 family AAA+-type ATPase [Sporomusaceae bacterium BoRhaA]|uniref:AAA family ATPase n=1 Tax=Pelorhabdus rhamnosifermentans TaxID=2772457 RepID=UPI001C063C06|nr:ATP-binding protein [Pelorhabdus rhamnosifermentans]MBU2701123.1 SpoVK/Ycf46/Vps4 family AAA+-type ATPase [Pelorhabdus rhamnosifermentans]
MPKIDEVTALINLIGKKDYVKAKQIVEVMIANERHNGRDMSARKLAMALRMWGDNNSKLVELPSQLKPLLFDSARQQSLSEIYLDDAIKAEIKKFIKERDKLEELRIAGLPMRNRILLAGPPGNGKTSLAGAISKELKLPFYAVKVSEIVDSALGATIKNIASVLECASTDNCAIFLDELDSIGSSRVAGADGCDREYNNALNTILTNLDRLPDTSIIIGATNLPDVIDSALLRRFNLKLWLDAPSNEDVLKYVLSYQCDHDVNFFLSDTDIVNYLTGQPWSKVEEFCLDHHRTFVLGEDSSGGSSNGWIGKAM